MWSRASQQHTCTWRVIRLKNTALTSDTTLKGRATISVKVGSNGSSCGVNVTSNELANPGVVDCTANYYRSGGFPAPKGGCVQVTVPINYVPGT